MKNKILLGSIIAVVILVLVSFTGVVGYQTAKSSTIAKASPLFNIRTSRAIGKESKDITCDYIGMGEENTLSFPKRDGIKIFMQKIIKIVNQMNDEKLEDLFLTLKNLMQKDDKFNNRDLTKIREPLHQLKLNDELKFEFNIDKFKSQVPTEHGETICFLTSGYFGLDCILFLLAIIAQAIVVSIALFFATIEVTIDIVQEIINYFKEILLSGEILRVIILLFIVWIGNIILSFPALQTLFICP